MECAICSLPQSMRHSVGDDWFLSIPGGDAPLAGWVALATGEHRETLDELSQSEAASLGPLLRSISGAIIGETSAERTYVANWAEGTRHVHFHVIPRPAELEPSRLGAAVFSLLGDDIPHPSATEQERVLQSIIHSVQRAGEQ
ncbi:hypothetical protein BH10ACT7_BH10ACT7_24330 [soil metagenome]